MSASTYDLRMDQGATFALTVSLKNADGTAFNLTAGTWAGQIRSSPPSSAVIVALTVATLGTATNGQFTISLTAAQTAALPVVSGEDPTRVNTVWCYDIELTQGGTVTRILQGLVIVSPEVTR